MRMRQLSKDLNDKFHILKRDETYLILAAS